jgi:hypothetical protein
MEHLHDPASPGKCCHLDGRVLDVHQQLYRLLVPIPMLDLELLRIVRECGENA